MKSLICLTVFLFLPLFSVFSQTTVEDFKEQAGILNAEGNTEAAVELMRKAAEAYPENSGILALLGFYIGKSAGETRDFQLQASRAFESFSILDKAVMLAPDNPDALFYRGFMSVVVPVFLGKLDKGIKDLETLLALTPTSSEEEDSSLLISARIYLAQGYEKRDDIESAIKVWEELLSLSNDLELSQKARDEIERLKPLKPVEDTAVFSAEDLDDLLSRAKSSYEEGEYFRAETLLVKAVELDDNRVETFSLLAYVYLALAETPYEESITEDTDYRTNLCFKAMNQIDKVLDIEPDNIEFKLLRGIMGVQFPFFVGKLEQGISDLNEILESDAPDSVKTAALFHIGYGYRKLGASKWTNVVNDYPSSQEAQWVFEVLNPRPFTVDFSSLEKPCLIIEFSLGFIDELPPQTAVWIEDDQENFIKTIYVSGFAGNVKAVQTTLPLWGNSSNFTTDANTGASIDLGNHVYTWNLKDSDGNTVQNGTYKANIEVSYWPSYQYEQTSVDFEIGAENAEVIKTDGRLLPYIQLRYME
ncbi:DUF2271 domain-containing protein [candidate division WOR-3 bacterium]|nr:DUF2271 domain-containing protein [candidate division WOR-3 bacterium]